jgi:hypothetical protein
MLRTLLTSMLLLMPLLGVAQDRIEITDGRIVPPFLEFSEFESHPAVLEAASQARAHWRATDPDFEEDFRVLSVTEGSFISSDDVHQAVLYLVSPWPRCCPRVGIALVRGDDLLQNITFEGVAQDLIAVRDLDDDGLSELAYIGTFGMGGENASAVTVVSIKPDGVRAWTSTGIRQDACAAGHEGAYAARLLAEKGPRFYEQRFTSRNCELDDWESDGEDHEVAMAADAEVRYLTLYPAP